MLHGCTVGKMEMQSKLTEERAVPLQVWGNGRQKYVCMTRCRNSCKGAVVLQACSVGKMVCVLNELRMVLHEFSCWEMGYTNT